MALVKNRPNITIATNVIQTSVSKSGLDKLIVYHWQVDAKNSKRTSTSGPLWQFTIGIAGMVPVQGATSQMRTTTASDLEEPVCTVALSNNFTGI